MIRFFSTLFLSFRVGDSTGSGVIVLDEPFAIYANDTVSSLYRVIGHTVSAVVASQGISVIFKGKIIPNRYNDKHTITDIGMNARLNDVQIIQKPVFVALLEMVSGLGNRENIQWFNYSTRCLSDTSANQCQNLTKFGQVLNGNLIEIDLSHLNLTESLHLASLPQTVRSLDLSFNDLDFLNFDALRDKSVEILNVEQNERCHINTECFNLESEHKLSIKVLQLSSYQIFPWIADPQEKAIRIRNWLHQTQCLERLIVDNIVMNRRRFNMPLHSRMLNVIRGVTNKEVIPWFILFLKRWSIQSDQWAGYRVNHIRKRDGYPSRYKFDLSGLGLEGEINLGALPPNVIELDLSNNNLSSICLEGQGRFRLRVLNIRRNEFLRIKWKDICISSRARCLGRLQRLDVSPNQLRGGRLKNDLRSDGDGNLKIGNLTVVCSI